MIALQSSGIDYARLRHAGRDVLSLALIDARNRTLAWATLLEEAPGEVLCLGGELPPGVVARLDPPLWTLGRIGWFQECWIARNVQRGRGDAADPQGPRLASILPGADTLYDPATVARPTRRGLAADGLPDLQATRQYLVETLETTLDLLDGLREEDDAALYFHRLALFHEEMRLEDFAVLAQTLGVAVHDGLVPRTATFAPRPPLAFPATRWLQGSAAPGFCFDNERAAHPVSIPEFEIDAQAVTWAQYGEFVEDGGYDDRAHWSEPGWAWVEDRVPAHAAPCRPAAPRGAAAPLRPAEPGRRRRAGGPCQRLRGRGLVPLGRAPAAGRGRVGGGGAPGREPGLSLRRCLGMDREHLPPLSGLRPRAVARLLLAELRPDAGPARRQLRNAARPAQRALSPVRRAGSRRGLLRLPQLRRLSAGEVRAAH